jgi:hypothetical protein
MKGREALRSKLALTIRRSANRPNSVIGKILRLWPATAIGTIPFGAACQVGACYPPLAPPGFNNQAGLFIALISNREWS